MNCDRGIIFYLIDFVRTKKSAVNNVKLMLYCFVLILFIRHWFLRINQSHNYLYCTRQSDSGVYVLAQAKVKRDERYKGNN